MPFIPSGKMYQNPPTFSAIPQSGQMDPVPAKNEGLNAIGSGYPMNVITQPAAANPSQVMDEAPKDACGCNGPCCLPLATACFLIGVSGCISALADFVIIIRMWIETSSYFLSAFIPPILLLTDSQELGCLVSVLFFVANVLLIVGSKTKNPVLVLIYMIVTGVDVLLYFIVICMYPLKGTFSSEELDSQEISYYVIPMFLMFYFVEVGFFYYQELKVNTTKGQGQVFGPSGQGQVFGQSGQGQVFGPSGQCQDCGTSGRGQVVGWPGQGQPYIQSY